MLSNKLQTKLDQFADLIMANTDAAVAIVIYGALAAYHETSTADDARFCWDALDTIIGQEYFDFLYGLGLLDQIDFERALIAEVYARWPKAGA